MKKNSLTGHPPVITPDTDPSPYGDKPSTRELLKYSSPYTFLVKNMSDAPQDIILLGHYEVNKEKMHKHVVIESAIPGIDYREIIWQFVSCPFRVGIAMISVVTGDVKKIYSALDTLRVQTKDANGNISICCTPVNIDPYQQCDWVWKMDQDFSIDSMTSLLFKLPPEPSISVRLYPSMNINHARALHQQESKREFSLTK